MMKYPLYLSLVMCLMFGQVALGENMCFSTSGNSSSWTITVSSGVATMSFANNEINTTSSSPDAVLNDLIDLPDMVMTNLQTTSINGIDIISAILVPDGSPLTVTADVASGSASAGQVVMSADLTNGGYINVGANFMAYSNRQDDLNITSSLAGYSGVIDTFVTADDAGLDVDLSFSGDTAEDLFDLLDGLYDGSVSGTLSGQITAVPEPGMIAMLSLVVGGFLLRRKYRA